MPSKIYTVYAQDWIETEVVVGTRVCGYSLHMFEDDMVSYNRQWNDENPLFPPYPDIYIQPSGIAYGVNVDKQMLERVYNSYGGIRISDPNDFIVVSP